MRRRGATQSGEGQLLPSVGLPDRYVSEPGADTPEFQRALALSAMSRVRRGG